MRPFVSVIIPVFNKEKYVARAIQSVLDQTYQELEILIIDDAATDGSMSKVSEFDDRRIKIFRRSTSGPGGYAARNLGVKKAVGDWVAFLDADDIWLPDHLDRAIEASKEFPEVPIISAGRINQFGTKQELDPFAERFMSQGHQVLYLSDYLKFACKGMRAMQTNTLLLKRNSLPSHMVFPEGRAERSGDLYAWVTLMARMKIMVWSPHVAAISFRDVIGVSRTNTPSITLFREMVDELSPYASRSDKKWLEIYANKMIKYAWLEKKKKRISLPFTTLPGSLFWSHDIFYCLKWTLISLFPFGFLEWLHHRHTAK